MGNWQVRANTLVPTAPRTLQAAKVLTAPWSPDEASTWTPIDVSFAKLSSQYSASASNPLYWAASAAPLCSEDNPQLRDRTFGNGLGGDASLLFCKTKIIFDCSARSIRGFKKADLGVRNSETWSQAVHTGDKADVSPGAVLRQHLNVHVGLH